MNYLSSLIPSTSRIVNDERAPRAHRGLRDFAHAYSHSLSALVHLGHILSVTSLL